MKSKFKTKKLPIKFLDNQLAGMNCCHQHRHTMAFFRYPPPQVEYMYTYIIFQNICNNLLFCIFLYWGFINILITQAHLILNIHVHTQTNILNCYIPDQLQYTGPETEYTRLHSMSSTLSSGPLSCFDVKRLMEYMSEWELKLHGWS